MHRNATKIGSSTANRNVGGEIPGELRGWIDRVIVPILVKEFLRAQSLQKEDNRG